MIRKLKKYELDYNKTYNFLSSVLKDGKTLAKELTKIDYKKGIFFTLLPQEAELSRIYQFPYGGIIPPKDVGYEPVYLEHLQKEFTPLKVMVLRDELANYIKGCLNNNNKLVCIFEDILSEKSDKINAFFKNSIFFYNKEVYYFVKDRNLSEELVLKIISKAEQVWHFISIIAETELNNIKNNEISLEKLKEICQSIKIIILGAYDGEGYIFWEKYKE